MSIRSPANGLTGTIERAGVSVLPSRDGCETTVRWAALANIVPSPANGLTFLIVSVGVHPKNVPGSGVFECCDGKRVAG
jgi:hypothetical protein